jgi:hypothetical protein
LGSFSAEELAEAKEQLSEFAAEIETLKANAKSAERGRALRRP